MSSDDDGGESTVAITGAAGRIGSAVLPLLRRPGRRLRLVDARTGEAHGRDLTWHQIDVGDLESLSAAFEGADAVIHLAGIPHEAAWDDVLRVNVAGSRNVLEAARRAGVTRVMLASSIHAVGYVRGESAADAPVGLPRPDTLYGWSKAAVESLGSLYSDRYGMSIVSARICTFQPVPRDDGRTAALWLSPADAARMIEAVIALDDGGHHIVWAVSANAPGWFPLAAGRDIGFVPIDDAVAILEKEGDGPLLDPDPAQLLGGPFIDPATPLGTSPR